MKKILIILLVGVLSVQVYAQNDNPPAPVEEETPMAEETDPNAIIPPTHMLKRPRKDDHFWRQRVVNRIDLREKINAPLVDKEMAFYNSDNNSFTERNGLVMALLNGLKNGEYNAYDPDSLTKPMSYEDVIRKFGELDGTLVETDEDLSEAEEGSEFFDFAGEDDFSVDEEDPFADDPFAEDPFGDMGAADSAFSEPDASEIIDDFTSLETVIEFVEDRIFDKVRSDMVYDIQYIQLVWTDLGGMLPESYLCVFRYDEVVGALEKAQWKNRFNDAEMRTLREVFDFRMFHSYIINVGGQGVRRIEEAEERRQKLVEFEHHLWSY